MYSNGQFVSREEESRMTREMCNRVELSSKVGLYILAMCRMKSNRLFNQVDMVLVAQLIKYVSLHKGDLKRQFEREGRYTEPTVKETKAANFTFLK